MKKNSKGIKNILVATDFSSSADQAMLKAIQIAKNTNAHITLLHVIAHEFLGNAFQAIIPLEIFQTPEEYAALILKKKIKSLARYQVKIKYVIADKLKPSLAICKYLSKHNVDLLIMGAHGKYSIKDTFVGTTADYLVKHALCPIMIVKNKPKKSIQKVLVPIDFSSISQNIMTYALQLFDEKQLYLMHVGDYESEEFLLKSEMKGRLSSAKVKSIRQAILKDLNNQLSSYVTKHARGKKLKSLIVELGYPGPTIMQTANKLNVDLILLGKQSHGKKQNLFLGSVAARLLIESNKDLLFIP